MGEGMGFLDLVFPGKTKMEVAANIVNATVPNSRVYQKTRHVNVN